MKSRGQWAEEQEEYRKSCDEVNQEPLRISGVVAVGVKETGNGLTEEIAFRVYINEKGSESNMPSEQVIPLRRERILSPAFLN